MRKKPIIVRFVRKLQLLAQRATVLWIKMGKEIDRRLGIKPEIKNAKRFL